MLWFADDIAMIADCEENLEKVLQKMNSTLQHEYKTSINKTETTILVYSK